MSEVSETVIEEDSKNNNEEVLQKVEEPKPEEIKVGAPEEKTKEEAPTEDEQFKNKTDRIKKQKGQMRRMSSRDDIKNIKVFA